jgi:dihydropteroate synthase
MLPVGVLRLGGRAFGTDELVVMAVVPAGAMEVVHAVVAEGADAVDLGGAVVPFVAAVREAYPELGIAVSAGRREVAREAAAAGADLLSGSAGWLAEVAASCGAGVAGPVGGAARAVAAGVEPERVIVGPEPVFGEAAGAGLQDLVASGWPVLASVPDPAGSFAGGLAGVAVAAWLGVRVFRVDRVQPTRRVLSMVSAIRGDIPPACAVRGLA